MQTPDSLARNLHPLVCGFSDAQNYALGGPYGKAVAARLLELVPSIGAGAPDLAAAPLHKA